MLEQMLEVMQGPRPRTVRTAEGRVLDVPAQWALLAPGDAALTRRVKLAGPAWVVSERKGRKLFSRGVWAPAETIERLQSELAQERADPRYTRKLTQGRERRAREQDDYVADFRAEVLAFLAFDRRYTEIAGQLAHAIAVHATPVGSGTVARTQRIPIAERAEAATIAWLRHQTTAYDSMSIPRIKGMRREVRRLLAQRARALLDGYRRGEDVFGSSCPLQRALRARAAAPDSASAG
jgi:hypothetical protein